MSDFERFEAMVTPEMIRAATEALGPCVGSCGEASPPDSYDIRCAIAAALAASHVPAGYKLVPVEPTREMLEAARDVKRERLLRAVKATQEGREPNISGQWLAVREEWDAMLDAAPTTPNGLTESAAPVPAPAQQVDAYTPEFLERVRLLAGRLRGTDWCKPDLRAAATLLEEFYLTATAALAPSVEAPAQQADRECRHCGWLCRPNPAESQRWYPLTDPALKESQR